MRIVERFENGYRKVVFEFDGKKITFAIKETARWVDVIGKHARWGFGSIPRNPSLDIEEVHPVLWTLDRQCTPELAAWEVPHPGNAVEIVRNGIAVWKAGMLALAQEELRMIRPPVVAVIAIASAEIGSAERAYMLDVLPKDMSLIEA